MAAFLIAKARMMEKLFGSVWLCLTEIFLEIDFRWEKKVQVGYEVEVFSFSVKKFSGKISEKFGS